MTYIYNDPAEFKDDVIKGFAAAYPQYVQRVEGASGFVRAGGPLEGKVSLVIGGGSGHFPSYNGVVGTGFADGAVLGDIFASPSAEQVYRIARAADGGAGVILAFGNYAGDRLNFGVAQERLIDEGIDTRIVYVTDDVASASREEQAKRRGIAGTFTVYKIAGAAAEDGGNLDEVERIMRAANAATYSFGVAFDGCTLPGADKPLFTVDEGQMDFGLGIHGEPGITSAPWMSAKDLAAKLVEAVLAERPEEASGRAAVLVNGLGATKYEELFVLYGHVSDLLTDAGVELISPEIGELVTSLDMAGCSLSVTWLDEELERCWVAPADTPAFRRGDAVASERFTTRRTGTEQLVEAETPEASEDSMAAAAVARKAVDEEWSVDKLEHFVLFDPSMFGAKKVAKGSTGARWVDPNVRAAQRDLAYGCQRPARIRPWWRRRLVPAQRTAATGHCRHYFAGAAGGIESCRLYGRPSPPD